MTTAPAPGEFRLPEPLSAEEEAAHRRAYLREQEKAIWMQYSMIAMQAIKLQGGEFKDSKEIAKKAANLADSMIVEYRERFSESE
jgi:hypothetical protein